MTRREVYNKPGQKQQRENQNTGQDRPEDAFGSQGADVVIGEPPFPNVRQKVQKEANSRKA